MKEELLDDKGKDQENEEEYENIWEGVLASKLKKIRKIFPWNLLK